MRLEDLLVIQDIDIHLGAAQLTMPANQGRDLVHIIGGIREAGIEVYLEWRSVSVSRLDRSHSHSQCGWCSILAEARVGIGAVGDGISGMPAIRCGSNFSYPSRG